MDNAGSILIVPLLTGPEREPIGAFSVYSAESDPRDLGQSEWYTKVLSILGRYAALGVQYEAHQATLRQVQEQRTMAEAFAAVGDIATNLLHSLNNKIGTIPVRVEGIQDKSQAALQADPYLAMNLSEIEKSASEAMKSVRESLYHLHPIELSPVNVADSVEDALNQGGVPPGVRVRCEGLDRLPPVLAGRRGLAMVFANLIENAVVAMESEGMIEISGVARDHWVEISVSDTGPGVPAGLQEKIFELNYSTHLSKYPGKLGFGLWWVKNLMARFSGRISVESEEGKGTRFILELPRAEAGS